MSSRRIKSESLRDIKEEPGQQNETKYFSSHFIGDNSPRRLNSVTNDVLMSADFPTRELVQGNENMLMDNHKHRVKTEPTFDEWESQYGSRPSDNNYGQPYRVNDRGVGGTQNTSMDRDRSRSRSSSPNQPRRDRTRGRDPGRARASPSRGSGSTRPEYSGARSRNEETREYGRNNRIDYNDQDHRQTNQSVKPPCRFFLRGNCNRNRCKFSHDTDPNSDTFHNPGPNFDEKNKPWNDPNPNSDTFHNSEPNFDEKNKSWNDPSWNNPESGGFVDVSRDIHTGIKQESQLDGQQIHGQYISSRLPTNLNGNGPIEASRNNNPQVTSETLANALGLLHSLPNPPSSGGPIDSKVNEPVKMGLPESQILVEPVKNPEVNETLTGQPENTNLGKSEVQVKVEEGNIGNDEKAMRAFKTALVEFVKEILKPAWKEGKMNREVYKTIVKKVVEKVTSTIQGNQIPNTQEKIDQYLSFSKSKITKLVEAYVGRFQKA